MCVLLDKRRIGLETANTNTKTHTHAQKVPLTAVDRAEDCRYFRTHLLRYVQLVPCVVIESFELLALLLQRRLLLQQRETILSGLCTRAGHLIKFACQTLHFHAQLQNCLCVIVSAGTGHDDVGWINVRGKCGTRRVGGNVRVFLA